MSGWDLILVDLRRPSVDVVETCADPSGSRVTYSHVYGIIRIGSYGMLVSSISTTSASNPRKSTSPSSELEPTPGVSTSPVIRPCLSVNVRILV